MSVKGPLWALKPSTIEQLSIELNAKKEILTDDGNLRDWRGLAELSGLANLIIQKIGDSPDPTKELFTQWKKTSDVNIEKLFEYLEVIDRFDVIDDNKENVEKDIAFAYKIAEEKGLALEELDVKTSITDHGKEALTYDDLSRLTKGQELMQYDAFILYGDDDKEFTVDLVKRLEKQGLKVCIKDRDLLGGAFEHEAVMKLIAERCSKLVPIFSPSFFTSENNRFLTSFAQHVSIEKCTRTLIPILYKTCDIPPNLSIYHKLVYKPDNSFFNFWKKLTDSIKPGTYKETEEENQTYKSIAQDSPPAKLSPEKAKDGVGSKTIKQGLSFLKSNKNELETNNAKKKEPSSSKTTSKESKKAAKVNKQEFSNVLYNTHANSDSSEPTSLELETQESRELLLPDVPKDNLIGKIRKTFTNKKSKNKYTKEASLC